MALVIGIDPGKSGAIALVEDNRLVWAKDCPIIKAQGSKPQYDERAMAAIFYNMPVMPDKIILEKVNAMPGQGVTSMFSFGMGFGIWLGILASLPAPYELVHPVRWKKDMLKDVPGDDQKARAVIMAKRLFPGLELPRKKDHGKADAILLAAWGARRA